MPIIKDPKMNPKKEKQYGIIEVNGMYCYYDKKNKTTNKQAMPAGYEIHNGITLSINPNPPVIIYDGKLVTIEAKINEQEIDNALPEQGEVPGFIYQQLKAKMAAGNWPTNSDLP